VTIIAVGLQTNGAVALIEDPDLASLVAGIVLMGGVLGLHPRYGCWNIAPVAECNRWFDSDAGRTVLGSGTRSRW
jgi:inosine-uridine nucleoside N-ribohydrolase